MSDVFGKISVQRLRVADMLSGLDDTQWGAKSLCAGWTNKHVVAHLTMPFTVSMPKLMLSMVKRRFDFNRVADDFARTAASQRSPQELTATLRANADHRFTPPGLGPEAPLTDIVVHGLDIAVPLGLDLAVDDEAVVDVLNFLVSKKATRGFVPKDRVPDLRFESTTVAWSSGQGPLVAGPATALSLAITGRTSALEQLSGDGLAEFTRRVAP
jgi:uncharacterized protein (TIGR03083 family)